jgi:hypothetical protein
MVVRMRELERAIVHAALFEARRFIDAGYSLEAAVEAACPAAWSPYKRFVYQALVCRPECQSTDDSKNKAARL